MTYKKREPVDDPILARIEHLLQAQHRTKKELMNHLGLQGANFTNWKHQQSKAYMKYIDKISEYLGCGTQYLIYGIKSSEDNDIILTSNEKKIIAAYRSLDDEKKSAFMNIITLVQR